MSIENYDFGEDNLSEKSFKISGDEVEISFIHPCGWNNESVSTTIDKKQAIALAKHFKLTESDLTT
jgi:hypothetical protein